MNIVGTRRQRLLLAAAYAQGSAPARGRCDAPGSSIREGAKASNSIGARETQTFHQRNLHSGAMRKTCGEHSASGGEGRVLDLGAGAGVSTQALWDVGWRKLTAVDPSRLAWDTLNEKLPPDVEFFMGATSSLSLSGRMPSHSPKSSISWC